MIFLHWKFQILTALEGYGLESHLVNETPPQSLTVQSDSSTAEASTATTTSTLNPVYMQWKRQDMVITSWLVGSMTDDILPQMLHCTSAKEIWTCLTQIFTTRNLVQMMKIKTKLQMIQKGGMSLKEYFSKIEQYVDALATVNKPMC